MAITFRANKDQALTYSEMDNNFGSFFYSSSVEGSELILHYTGSQEVPINQSSHRIQLRVTDNGDNVLVGSGTDKHIAIFSGSTGLVSSTGLMVDEGKVGINIDPTLDIPLTYQLEVSGSIRTSDGVLTNSDRTLKENITPIENGLQIVDSLEGVNFQWKDSNKQDKGFIAQDLKEVLPELVSEDLQGILSVNYTGVIPVLVQAIKELKQEVEDLKRDR